MRTRNPDHRKSEECRLEKQAQLDAERQPSERNRLGQFATPPGLARDVVSAGISLLPKSTPIRFLDPAFGSGSFYSALLHVVPRKRIQSAQGFEIDAYYGQPAADVWCKHGLQLELKDFTRVTPPGPEEAKSNLLICNPPYVRHHHIGSDKFRLQDVTHSRCGVRIGGLAGLYCYFLGLSHSWLSENGVACWLIPSEFMDVNYGVAVKDYLTRQVTLLQIHRFDPNDVQFDDALVSSAVVLFKKALPQKDHKVLFSYGGALSSQPQQSRSIPLISLVAESKWTRFPAKSPSGVSSYPRLSSLFRVNRGIATGNNAFFIMTKEKAKEHGLPAKFLRPILPSPRYLKADVIQADSRGFPVIDRRLFLLDCDLPPEVVQRKFPKLWEYLSQGLTDVAERYLCRKKKIWYSQEKRDSPPILCTYLGRSDSDSSRPFRFILNQSTAIAANVYHLLYPTPIMARAIEEDKKLLEKVWETLNQIPADALLSNGRVYGGGLHKLEPRELGNIDASSLVGLSKMLSDEFGVVQPDLFGTAAG